MIPWMAWIGYGLIFIFFILIVLYKRHRAIGDASVAPPMIHHIIGLRDTLSRWRHSAHYGYMRIEALSMALSTAVKRLHHTWHRHRPLQNITIEHQNLAAEERVYLHTHGASLLHDVPTSHTISDKLGPMRLEKHSAIMDKIFGSHTEPTSRRFWQLLRQRQPWVATHRNSSHSNDMGR